MDERTSIFLFILAAGISLGAMFLIIKAAVKSALRDHQEWLDERAEAKPVE